MSTLLVSKIEQITEKIRTGSSLSLIIDIEIDEEDIKKISSLLYSNNIIFRFAICNNNIDAKWGTLFHTILSKKDLNIELFMHNNIFLVDGMQEFANAVIPSTNLIKLDFHKNNFLAADNNRICTEMFIHNKSIKEMYFYDNDVVMNDIISYSYAVSNASFKKLLIHKDSLTEYAYSTPDIVNLPYLEKMVQVQSILFESLGDNLTLTQLSLFYNFIPPNNIKILTESLKRNTSLTHFYLNHSNLGNEGVKMIAEALKVNNVLELLSLIFVNIDDMGMEYLAQALKHNQKISTLYLCENEVSNEGFCKIAEMLQYNSTIKTICFTDNNITNEGIEKSIEFLKNNSSIKRINFNNNKIGDEGARMIGELMKDHKSLDTVFLARNNITDIGAEAFINALCENENIKLIILQENPIEDWTKIALKLPFEKRDKILLVY